MTETKTPGCQACGRMNMLITEPLPGSGPICVCTPCRHDWHRLMLTDYSELMTQHHVAMIEYRQMATGFPSASGVYKDTEEIVRGFMDVEQQLLAVWDQFVERKKIKESEAESEDHE